MRHTLERDPKQQSQSFAKHIIKFNPLISHPKGDGTVIICLCETLVDSGQQQNCLLKPDNYTSLPPRWRWRWEFLYLGLFFISAKVTVRICFIRCFVGRIAPAMVSHSTFKLLSRTADIPLPDLWIAIPHTEPNNGPTDTQQESPAMEQNTCKFLLLLHSVVSNS
jgi:hypothetical protein